MQVHIIDFRKLNATLIDWYVINGSSKSNLII